MSTMRQEIQSLSVADRLPLLEEIAREYPKSDEASKALYQIGQIYWNRHDNARALDYFQSLLEKYPASAYADRARFAFQVQIFFRLSRDQLSAQQTQARALACAYALAVQRYENGVASYLEVLDAQRSLFTAELALVAQERQYLAQTVRLYRALGGGWDRDRDR